MRVTGRPSELTVVPAKTGIDCVGGECIEGFETVDELRYAADAVWVLHVLDIGCRVDVANPGGDLP